MVNTITIPVPPISDWGGSNHPHEVVLEGVTIQVPPGLSEANQIAYAQQQLDLINHRNKKYMKYPEIKEAGIGKRRLFQPKFRLPFETFHDCRMRLNGTVVYVSDLPFYVRDVIDLRNPTTGEKDYLLIVEDQQATSFRIWYSDPRIDLRNPEPQYITYERQAVWLTRRPYRQQRQGLSYDNALLRIVGSTKTYRPDRLHDLVGSLRTPEPLQWSPQYYDLMQGNVLTNLRLSPTVAVFRGSKKTLRIEYKGRELGDLHENTVILDEDDYQRPWIKRDIQEIGCIPGREK